MKDIYGATIVCPECGSANLKERRGDLEETDESVEWFECEYGHTFD